MKLSSSPNTTMPNATDRARSAILAELRPLQLQATSLREQLADIDAEQAPLEAALAALEARPKIQEKAISKAKRPCAKKADVKAVCHALLVDNGSLSQDDLEGLAKAKLSGERGLSLSGFGLRFKECLASSGYSVSADGVVSLAATKAPRVDPPAVDNSAARRAGG